MKQRNWGARLREFEWLGLPALSLENELLRIGILAGKGADVFEFLFKPRDIDFVWLTTSGFRNPREVGAAGPLAFIDTYGGGWQEILPSGGEPSSHAGIEYGQHDEVSMLPWAYEVVEDEPGAVAVRLSVDCVKTPFRLVREVRLEGGSMRLAVLSTVTNLGVAAAPFMWGQHLAFGPPFLAPGARITLPDGVEGIPGGGGRVREERFSWPAATSPDGEPVDLSVLPGRGAPSDIVYLTGFPERAWYEVACGGLAFRVEWDATVLAYLWFWQEFGATAGYPWYGRHWNIGLEPFSSYPTNGLAEAVANGTALELGSGEQRSLTFSAEVLAS